MNLLSRALSIILCTIFLSSCATFSGAFSSIARFFFPETIKEAETQRRKSTTETAQQTVIPKIVAPPTEKHAKKESIHEPITEMLYCDEKDPLSFNNIGIESLPFLKPLFYDIDGDGKPELIAGSKYGDLKLYRNISRDGKQKWQLVSDYFKGINVGFFSAPAIADINGDGKAEVAVGVGGFSNESGKVFFYKNHGTVSNPSWKKMNVPNIKVGNDASPVFVDVNGDGKPDIIVGNSAGKLFLFINTSTKEKVSFTEDKNAFKNLKFGMYATVTALVYKKRCKVIVGTDVGKLFLLEKPANNKATVWNLRKLKISVQNFASPSFVKDRRSFDLVVADSNGKLSYFKNRNFFSWSYLSKEFREKIHTGFACSPVISEIDGKNYMIIGNISGNLKLYEFNLSGATVNWVERANFFKGIRLTGFSRGLFAKWNNSIILVAGQQDGTLKAFMNNGNFTNPRWTEIINFFAGIKVDQHSAPAIFDIYGNGLWDMVVGDYNGNIHAFRISKVENNLPVWERINIFGGAKVKVKNYAVPSLFKHNNDIYLIVGQQDGKVKIFRKEVKEPNIGYFKDYGFLNGVEVKSHNSPFIFNENGMFLFAVGDYDGNIKLFTCPGLFGKSLKTAFKAE